MLFEPFVGSFFFEDGEDVNVGLGDVVIDAEIIDAETILRLAKATVSLDAGLALFARFVAEMSFDGRCDGRAINCAKPLQILDSLWSEDDLIRHSGQNMARNDQAVKTGV
jgi:hypothetical protein